MAKMAVARIKLLRNKREVVVMQMRRDIAMLLQTKQHATARIMVLLFPPKILTLRLPFLGFNSLRTELKKMQSLPDHGSIKMSSFFCWHVLWSRQVEHLIREQNVLAANELIQLFCELIVARLPAISKKRSSLDTQFLENVKWKSENMKLTGFLEWVCLLQRVSSGFKGGNIKLDIRSPKMLWDSRLVGNSRCFRRKVWERFCVCCYWSTTQCWCKPHGKFLLFCVVHYILDATLWSSCFLLQLIEKLSVKAPNGEVKMKVLKDCHGVQGRMG